MVKYEYFVSLIYDQSTKDNASNLKEALLSELQSYIKAKICNYFTSSFNILHNQIEKLLEGPKLIVYFGSVYNKKSKDCIDLLREAKNAGIFIIPVLHKKQNFNDCIPDILKKLNIFYWNSKNFPEKQLARKIFENLGIEDKNRRIFISYRRNDGQGMADQLFDKLSRQKFNVFLDKYDIDIGVNFQQKIYESLEDKSFLLVIESPNAKQSQWISKEIIYALNHEIPVNVVSWCSKSEEISETIGLPKLKLDINSDLINNGKFYVIKENLIEGIINEIESFHAYGLNQRRNDFMRDIETKCSPNYHHYGYLQNWVIYFTDSKNVGSDSLITITPRVPQAEDLHYIDDLSRKIIDFKDDTKKILYHKSEKIPEAHKKVLEWILLGKKKIYILAH